MAEGQGDNSAPNLFGNISEADRMAALDAFGQLLMGARDTTIVQWDQILAGGPTCGLWERVQQRFPDNASRKVIAEVLPHVVDAFMYNLLDALDGSQTVRVAVTLGDQTVPDLARVSWGLATEPVTDNGWLVRFSKQRFERPE